MISHKLLMLVASLLVITLGSSRIHRISRSQTSSLLLISIRKVM